jgi:transcriptional regulator with XRE-family HTH domain
VDLEDLGAALVAFRLASGMTQKELARRLDVSASQVCRDERNEYQGVSVEKAKRILDALGARVKATFEGFISGDHGGGR